MEEETTLEQNETPEAEDRDETQAVADEDTSKQSESNDLDPDTAQEVGTDQGEIDDDSAESDSDDDDDAMVPLSKLRKVRNEAKNLRERLKIAETRVEELEGQNADEALTQERDALLQKVADLEKTLTTERLSTHLHDAAATSGAIEPAVVAMLVDADKVEWSDEGKPTNLDALITDLKTAYPKMFSATQGTGNAGSRSETRGRDEAMTPSSRLANAYKK